MEALSLRIICLMVAQTAASSNHSSTNFVVTAPTPEIAQQVCERAEFYRRELAMEWLGHELRPWYAPCPIFVKVGHIGAGGSTSFSFDRGEVFGWKMEIQGSLERILDSVLPHEVSHTIFACHFRRPLPRWADEGAATLAEVESERRRQTNMVRQVMKSPRRIPLKTLLKMTEYPSDMKDVLTLYAEGYALCDLLVQKGGKARYLALLTDAQRQGWDRAFQRHYGFKGVEALEQEWESWIIAGCPELTLPAGQQLADARTTNPRRSGDAPVVRSQSPDEEPEARLPAARSSRNTTPRGVGLEAPSPRRHPEQATLAAADNDRFQLPLSERSSNVPNTAPRGHSRAMEHAQKSGWVAVTERTERSREPAATASELPWQKPRLRAAEPVSVSNETPSRNVTSRQKGRSPWTEPLVRGDRP